jgi:hypothetical protein
MRNDESTLCVPYLFDAVSREGEVLSDGKELHRRLELARDDSLHMFQHCIPAPITAVRTSDQLFLMGQHHN